MKSILTILFLTMTLFSFKNATAQPQSDFEIVAGKNDSDIVYRGTLTFDDIRKVPAFHLDETAAAYKTDDKAIQKLSAGLNHYQLVIFLGTWCEDSHIMIPQLYKVLELVHYPMEKLSLNALDRDKQGKGTIATSYNITLVPTVVVLKDGKEIGRITEIPDKTVEQDLAKIIQGKK